VQVKEASAPTETAARHEPAGPALLAAACGALLYAAALLVPILALLNVAAAFPFAVQRLRGGAASALLAALAAAALLAISFPPGHAVVFLVMRAVPGLVMGEAMARGRGLRRATAWTLLLVTLQSAALLVFAGDSIAKMMLGIWDQVWSPAAVQGLRDLGGPPEQVTEWVAWAAMVRAILEIVYPAVFLIFNAIMVLGNGWLLRTYLARRDPGWLEGGEFEGMRWPLGLAGAFVLAGAAVASPPLRPFAYNALVVLAFCFGLQGLAVVTYYLRRLAAPALLIAIVMAVLLLPYALYVLALLGLFDIFIDFRKWAEPPVAEG
jgi:predicted membrane protein DUF2232